MDVDELEVQSPGHSFQFEHQWVWASYRILEEPNLTAIFVSHFSLGRKREKEKKKKKKQYSAAKIVINIDGRRNEEMTQISQVVFKFWEQQTSGR